MKVRMLVEVVFMVLVGWRGWGMVEVRVRGIDECGLNYIYGILMSL